MSLEKLLPFISALGENEGSSKILCAIAEIGQNFIFEDNTRGESYYEFFESGISFIFEDSVLVSIVFYVVNTEGYKPCNLASLLNIDKLKGKDDVITWLGLPSISGGGTISTQFGYIFPWIKYQFNQYSIHFEFSETGESIKKMSLMV